MKLIFGFFLSFFFFSSVEAADDLPKQFDFSFKMLPHLVRGSFDIRIPNSLPNAKSIGAVGDLKQDAFIPLEAEGGIWKGSGYIACDDSENGAKISGCADGKASPDPKQIIGPAAAGAKLEWKAGISDLYKYCFVKLADNDSSQAADCGKKVEFSAMILHLSYSDLFLDNSSIKLKVANDSDAGQAFVAKRAGDDDHQLSIRLQFKCASVNNLGVSGDCSNFNGGNAPPGDIDLDLEAADKRDFVIVGYISSLISKIGNKNGLMPPGDYVANDVSLDIVLG